LKVVIEGQPSQLALFRDFACPCAVVWLGRAELILGDQ
jgi:hypothetical protein